MSEYRIELKVYDKVFSFRKVHGEWEAEQVITGPTMTPIMQAALDRCAAMEPVVEAAEKYMAERFLWDCDTKVIPDIDIANFDEEELELYNAIQVHCGYPVADLEGGGE